MSRELYTGSPDDECECPIHRDGSPPTLPLGIDFESRVEIENISKHVARRIYEAHHSYMPSVPKVNKVHHGIFLDGHIVGALTYRHPLMQGFRDYGGGEIIEINRICIGVPMKNLASCGMAASQDKFVNEHGKPNGIRLLITFIRVDHTGSMLRALLDKGWELSGIASSSQAGNRPDKEIREWDKHRWICEIPSETEQATLDSFGSSPVPA